jgi:hypothetical protein
MHRDTKPERLFDVILPGESHGTEKDVRWSSLRCVFIGSLGDLPLDWYHSDIRCIRA